jgi:tetratricopeptide (TPR) repeat protein
MMVATLLLSFCLGFAADEPVQQAENPLAINDEIREFLATKMDHNGDSLAQLQSLVRMVFQENALNFNYVPETRTAIETFDKRGGNCISFTFLLIAMARQLGMDARFREVDIVPTWSKVGNIVSMIGHANAAVFIGGEGYVVDLFPRVDRIQIGGRVVSDNRAFAHFFSNQGVAQLGSDHPQQAIAYFKKALDSDPTAAFVWTNLGVAQAFMGSLAEAEKSYLKALQLDPSEAVAMSNLSSLYENTGRKAEAKRFAAKVQRFKQKNPYYHFSLGLQAYASGDYRESIDHYKTALKLKSAEHNFYLALARSYIQLGQMDKASDSLRLALKNAPDNTARSRYSEKLALLAAQRAHS